MNDAEQTSNEDIMMQRTRSYRRKMRAKHIKRKKDIVANWHWWGENPSYYPHDGMYSKNKIHCSCSMCKTKAYYGKHIPTIQEQKNFAKAAEFEND